MKLVIRFLYQELVSIELSIPRLSLFAPGELPNSIEAVETWGDEGE